MFVRLITASFGEGYGPGLMRVTFGVGCAREWGTRAGRWSVLSGVDMGGPVAMLITIMLILILNVISFFGVAPSLLPGVSFPCTIVVAACTNRAPRTIRTAISGPLRRSVSTVSNIGRVGSASSSGCSLLVVRFRSNAGVSDTAISVHSDLSAVGNG